MKSAANGQEMEQRIINSLLKSSAYPEPTESVQLIQTHVSLIFLTDNHVYKIKKSVNLGFLNFSTIDRRRFYCTEEVRLNQRLCPGIYLGVVEVRDNDGVISICGDGTVIDYAVKMVRLPAERMLDRLLENNAVTDSDVRLIARTIADFHLGTARSPEIEQFGSMENIQRNWAENFEQVIDFIGTTVTERDLTVIRRWVGEFLQQQELFFARRVKEGYIRDCDGDIHLGNICLTRDGQVHIFDCIEFNRRFRYSDTAADIAFLLMDLDFHDRPSLGQAFLDEYMTVTGDVELLRVIDFYKIYRAFIRGKVESMRLGDPLIPFREKEEAQARAQRYLRLARGYVLRNDLPLTLFITCGLTGSGKTSVASELSRELGLAMHSSDVVRKELAGITPATRALDDYNSGLYSAEHNRATYGELVRLAEQLLADGKSCIIDATFRRRDDRAAFTALARQYGASIILLLTSCPEELSKERFRERAARPEEPSDGRWEIFIRQQHEFEMPSVDEGNILYLDTSHPTDDLVDEILSQIGILP